MSKVAVVFWSGTGNTAAMTDHIIAGAKGAGAEVDVFQPNDFPPAKAADYQHIAFGCPSMGDEVLEEEEFQPMWDALKSSSLNGKKLALYGSYGWGDGEWMRLWEKECDTLGLNVLQSLMCNEYPDADGQAACKALGATLANA